MRGTLRRPLFWALAAALMAAPALALEPPALDLDHVYRGGVPEDGMVVADRVIVHFDPASVPTPWRDGAGKVLTGDPGLDQVSQRFGVHRMERLFAVTPAESQKDFRVTERERVFAVDFDARHELADVFATYQALPGVTRVEPVGIHYFDAFVPDDPSLAAQTWLRNTSPGGRDIRALAGWSFETGDPNVIVAVADSGVDWMHPDLGGTGPDYTDGNIWINEAELNGTPGVDDDSNGRVDDIRGWDFVTGVEGAQTPPQDVDVPDNDPMDYESHGTWVAGCVAAIGNNGIGVAGVAYDCRVMALRIGWLPGGAQGGVVRMDFAAQALDYARANGARIFNASWGNSNSGGLGVATNNAVAAGMLILNAAGNDDDSQATYFATHPDVVAVAAVNFSDGKSTFSNFGSWVEISAPGSGIFTTEYDRFGSGGSEHTYGSADGTSFASPIAAGVAALIMSANPAWSLPQVRSHLLASVDELDSRNPGFIGQLGSGRVNLAKVFGDTCFEVPLQLPSLRDAINNADDGDVVWIEGGFTVTDQVFLPDRDVEILGGWDATFTTRDPVANPTIVDRTSAAGPVLTALAGVTSATVIDGFRLIGGTANVIPLAPVTGKFGGTVLLQNASPVIRNCVLTGGVAGAAEDLGGGGGLAVIGGAPVLENVEITGCSSSRGGGVYVFDAAPVFRQCDIHDNTLFTESFSIEPEGGGLYVVDVQAPDGVTLEQTRIANHVGADRGGGLFATNSEISSTDVTVEGNSAVLAGGGIYVSGGSFDGTNSILQGNMATGASARGAGYYAMAADVILAGGTVQGNESAFAGGGVELDACADPDVSDLMVYGNTASFFGTGIFLDNCTGSILAGNTVVDNSGAVGGANGVYLLNGSATVSNNISAFNGGGGSSQADGFHSVGAAVSFDCNVTWMNDAGSYGGSPDPTGSDGNTESDPTFRDRAMQNYNVIEGSPADPDISGSCGRIGAGNVVPAVPVLVSSMRAEQVPGGIEVRWTVHDVDNALGFRVVRSRAGQPTVVTPQPLTPQTGEMSVLDDVSDVMAPARLTYYLEVLLPGDIQAILQETAVQFRGDLPGPFLLAQNTPNPFNPSTAIDFTVPNAGRWQLQILDAAGRRVRTLVEAELAAGSHTYVWNGTDDAGRPVASGVYSYQLRSDSQWQIRRMTLLK